MMDILEHITPTHMLIVMYVENVLLALLVDRVLRKKLHHRLKKNEANITTTTTSEAMSAQKGQ